MEDAPLSYHARFLDHGDGLSPEDATLDPALQKTLAALYDRQRAESLRLYNDTSRSEAEIDLDMAALDIAHEGERTRYIEDYQRAKALSAALQRGPDLLVDEQRLTR